MKSMRAEIAGGGVAGLASAIALARQGWDVRVHERAEAIREVGAGLQLSPNGLVVLNALGLDDAIAQASIRADAVRLIDGLTGRDVLQLDLERDAPDLAWRFVHRAALIEVLRAGAEAAGVRVVTGSRIGAAERAEFHAEGAFVIGADGLRSATRTALLGAARPRFSGQIAWRAVIEDDAPPEAQVWMLPGRHLVSYPLQGGRRNIVAVRESAVWAEEGWSHEGEPDDLRAAFADLAGPARDWLAQVEKVMVWGLYLHPVASRWHDGQATALVGDAAHPTLPFLAQGANLALEDAWVLAESVRDGVTPAGLDRYQRVRAPRARRTIAAATRNTLPYHLKGALRPLGHGLMKLGGQVAPAQPLKRFDWLYRYDVTAEG